MALQIKKLDDGTTEVKFTVCDGWWWRWILSWLVITILFGLIFGVVETWCVPPDRAQGFLNGFIDGSLCIQIVFWIFLLAWWLVRLFAIIWSQETYGNDTW